MPEKQNRKLQAILFADIAGYTALVQQDENRANKVLEKFHRVLKAKTLGFNGQVINNYEDGCLCTFDSAVDAVNCAEKSQLVFQKELVVPVRIGLHSGDVYFKEGNVYGDSVNISSRIESLGIPGAVLFSDQIRRHLANHKTFKVKSLGEFAFKNVTASMEVFALANEDMVIPKKEQLKGKLVPKGSDKNKWILPAIIGMILLGLVAFGKLIRGIIWGD